MPHIAGTSIYTRRDVPGGASAETGEVIGVDPATNIHNTHCDICARILAMPYEFLRQLTVRPHGNTNNSVRDRWIDEKGRKHKAEAWIYNGSRYLELKTWPYGIDGTPGRPVTVEYKTDIAMRLTKLRVKNK